MKKKTGIVRLGIVGCGGVTRSLHLPALRRVAGIEVSALADTDGAALERAGEQAGVSRRYADYRELMASEDVGAVAVCVPPRLHAEVALAALAAGKHVFIEKPPALGLEECDLMLERAAGRAELKVMVGFNLRWHRLLRAAKEAVGRGELGPVKLARTVFTNGGRLRDDFAGWRLDQSSGGGALFELGVHHFDLLRFLFGREVTEVYASSEAEGAAAIVLAQLEGGVQVASAFADGLAENHEIEIYGELGRLRVSCYRADGFEKFRVGQYPGALGARLREVSRTLLEAPRLVHHALRGGDYAESYAEQWRHFAGAMTSDAPVACTLTDGRRALEIALAAIEADATKRTVVPHRFDSRGRADEEGLRAVARSGVS
jgi:myo-inositol 2-dehydrogenase/D-chiro-inositol 1-dehydrogenase